MTLWLVLRIWELLLLVSQTGQGPTCFSLKTNPHAMHNGFDANRIRLLLGSSVSVWWRLIYIPHRRNLPQYWFQIVVYGYAHSYSHFSIRIVITLI